jgi:hypothetical protein
VGLRLMFCPPARLQGLLTTAWIWFSALRRNRASCDHVLSLAWSPRFWRVCLAQIEQKVALMATYKA